MEKLQKISKVDKVWQHNGNTNDIYIKNLNGRRNKKMKRFKRDNCHVSHV